MQQLKKLNEKNVKIVEKYIKERAFDMICSPSGEFIYPYLDPGAQYGGDLWDWDSHFSAAGLMYICEYFKNDEDFDYEERKKQTIEAAKGCVSNFLRAQLKDGFIPIQINNRELSLEHYAKNYKQERLNQHKPFLCQSVLNVSKYSDDFNWFSVEPLIKYIDYYKKEQFHQRSGLYVWKSDYMIGIDSNPSVFGMPYESVGDIYLNTFMYLELLALAEILEKKNDNRAGEFAAEAERLKNTIKKECWDCRDGLYYSVFVDLAKNHGGEKHSGMEFFWKSLPIKVRMAACFLPMYAGISTKEQDKEMIEKHYLDDKFLSPAGIRSLAEDERMYYLKGTSNPSNSMGPVWLIYNYFSFYGLIKANRKDLAEDLCARAVDVYAEDIQKTGKICEAYHPITKESILDHSFLSWNILIIKMIGEIV